MVCMAHNLIPEAPLGLYNPEDDRDACGVGFIAELDKVPTRACVVDAIEALRRMTHRGACGCEVNTGVPLAALFTRHARRTCLPSLSARPVLFAAQVGASAKALAGCDAGVCIDQVVCH